MIEIPAGTMCEHCGAQVLRVRDATGQWLALEPTPSPGSEVYTIMAVEGGKVRVLTHCCIKR